MLSIGLKNLDPDKIPKRSREEMVERFRTFNQQEQKMKAEFKKKGMPEPKVLA
jgi:hypothetical protein